MAPSPTCATRRQAYTNDRNNFIIGQITPDLLTKINYGTYVLFGIITTLGAGFIWFFVPETKRLSLEEMDLIFGSEGTAAADAERMEEINREIGLNAALHRGTDVHSTENVVVDNKAEV
jgi:hypothetical protein